MTISRYHASEDNNAEYPERHTEEEEFSFDSLSDMYEDKECKEILDRIYENNLDELAKSLAEETHAKYAKPEGDRVAAYNNALKYAKKDHKPYIYGYTNHTGKFFAAETPMKVTGKPVDAEKEFRSRYKNCNAVYVVYPDKDFIKENLDDKSLKDSWKPFDYKDYNGDEVVTVVLTDKRFEPLSNKHQREILNKHNVRIEVHYLNGTVVTGRVSDIIQACIECHIINPTKIFEKFDEEVCCTEEKINIDYVVSLFGDGSHYYKEDNDIPLSPDISGATKFNKKKDISILDIVKDVCEYSAKYMPENEAASLFDLDTLEEVYEKDEDYFINSGLVEIISVYKMPESLEEAKEELPADPEAAKLEVHTMLNDLVADEIEAINGYDDAKAEIIDTPIAHKDNILDTIDHIKGEEQEHIDELIDATTEIPFDKEEETPAPKVEEPFNQDFPEVDEEQEEKSLTETKAKPEGDKVKSYNDGLKLAKLHSKPVIYGYTNSSYGNKFFALDDPIVCDNVSDETKKFRRQYKSCNVVYVAYPNDQFVED